MVKLLLFIVLFYSCNSAADVYLSSFTKVTRGKGPLCGDHRGYLHRVCVTAPVSSSTMSIANSSWTVNPSLTGTISTTAFGCLDFQITAPGGLYLDKWGTANINIFYDCYGEQ